MIMRYRKGELRLLVPEPTDSYGELLVTLSAEYTSMLETHQSDGVATRRLPSITFGWLADTSLNGEACYIEEAPYSILNQGVPLFAAPYFRCLLSNPSCLPQIGDPSREKSRLRYPSWKDLRSIAQNGFTVALRDVNRTFRRIRPRCPIRARYADILMLLACNFVAFHEAWHHLAGHVGYIEHQSSPIRLRETPNSYPGFDDVMLHQACEIDADSRAAETMAALLWLARKRSESYIFETFKDNLEQAMRAWLFAQMSMHLVWFDGLDVNAWDASLKSTHPHPALRATLCFYIGLAKLNELDSNFRCKADSAVAAVLDAVQAAKSTFAGVVLPIEPLLSTWHSQLAKRYGQILQVLMRLQPEFVHHAYWLKPLRPVDDKHLDAVLHGNSRLGS
jgi:hypothetical protein